MSNNNNIKKRENEVKYHMLRSQLDKLHFIQPMDYNSLDIIESMLNEILSLRQKNKAVSSLIEELQEKNEHHSLMITAYKHQNVDLFKQNGELHQEVLSLLEKNGHQGKDMEMKRLNEDTNTLKFLLNASKEKTLQYQNELTNVKQKYMELLVNFYQKKVDISKIFTEITENDQLNLKPKEIENTFNVQGTPKLQFGPNNNSSSNNTSHNKYNITNNNNNREYNQNIIGNKQIRSIQEMVEKIYKLETELKEKNSEIMLLKKNLSNENALDQKVIIDYLKNELKTTKEKYEGYLKFQLDKNNSNSNYNNKIKQCYPQTPQVKRKMMTSEERKEIIKMNNIQKENKELQGKLDMFMKENGILKEELNDLLEKNVKAEKYIQNELEKDFVSFSKNNQNYLNTEVNLISSLSEKIKESNSNLNSSKNHFKNQMIGYENKYKQLEKKLSDMDKNLKQKDKICAQQKETINSLNQRLLTLSSETTP